MAMTIDKFNIRVYGIIINERNEILLADEFALNTKMTKFPGGGMHFGEGTIDCIKREAVEEFGQKIEILEHFYTTDFFQPALFYTDMQLISIYFRVRFIDPIQFKISEKPFDFKEEINGSISFRWKPIKSLNSEDLTFPIDRHVVNLLKEKII
jgi:ADP-ribose pyrophosphatase YjhB (NUDIX family)